MIDWGLISGISAFGMVAMKFAWEASDVYKKKMADTILASKEVKDAVGDVAIAACTKSKEFVMQNIYDTQREYHEEKLEKVIADVLVLSNYIMSDELPKKIADALDGMPMRRIHMRGES